MREQILRMVRYNYDTVEVQNILRKFVQGKEIDQLLFSGAKWLLVRHRIATLLHKMNLESIKRINAVLPYAFAEGANVTIYFIGEPLLPYIPQERLVNPYKLNRKDISWLEKKIQVCVNSAVIQKNDLPRMASDLVLALTERMMDGIKQAAVYGAFDAGIYQAGKDAEKAGIEVEKTWLGILDKRIRDSHRHLHNTTIPFDDVFHGLNGDLRFPHDPKAPPSETYRCRCKMAVHKKGKKIRWYDELSPSEVAAYRKWRDKAIQEAKDELWQKR